MGGRYVPSLLAAIGEVIENHMIEIGFLAAGSGALAKEGQRQVVALENRRPQAVRQCPKCGAAGLLRQEGCDLCTSCGYSKCG